MVSAFDECALGINNKYIYKIFPSYATQNFDDQPNFNGIKKPTGNLNSMLIRNRLRSTNHLEIGLPGKNKHMYQMPSIDGRSRS
jgi:hypothetical protein